MPPVRPPLSPTPPKCIRRLLLLSCALVLATVRLEAAPHGQAIIRTFDAADAPIKDAVRSVIVAHDGTVLVGSNQLAAFDGHAWEKIEIPGAYGFRALAEATSSGPIRVYVGAIETLGYVERARDGEWAFTRLGPESLSPGDIWSVHALGNSAVWIGTDRVFRWNGATIDVLRLPNPTQLAGFDDGDEVLIYQEGTGLVRIGATGDPKLVVTEADLPQKPVNWMIGPSAGTSPAGVATGATRSVPAPTADTGKEALIGLRDGAYRWDGGRRFTRLGALSDALKGTIPTSAATLPGGRIAVGTFNAGIVLATRSGEVVGQISKASGLGPGNVFALASSTHQLWTALPEGLARIEAPGEAMRFDRRQDLDDGSPRRVVGLDGRAYVLTSSGIFEADVAGLERRASLSEIAWDATVAADSVWAGGFGGIWRLHEGRMEHVHHVSTDVLALAPSGQIEDGVLFTEGYDLKSLVPSPHGGWAARELGFRSTDTPVCILEDGKGQVWLSTMKEGIFRLRWIRNPATEPPHLQFLAHYRAHHGLGSGLTRPQLTLLGGTLFALGDEGIAALREDGAGFMRVPALGEFGGVAATRSLPDGSAYWLMRRRGLDPRGAFAVAKIRINQGRVVAEPIEVPGLDEASWKGIDLVGRSIWLTGNREAVRIDAGAISAAPPPPELHLTSVRWHDANGRTLPADVPSNAPGLALALTFPARTATTSSAVFYQTRLTTAAEQDDSGWSPPGTDPHREFVRLAPGHYVFQARAVDRFGRKGRPVSLAFSIPLPWWRTPLAWIAYSIVVVLAVAGAARWRINRLKRLNERLNRIVADRTRELELSNTAKSEFLENISHEIRNPLNGLTGLLTMLKEEGMAPAEREHVKSLRAVASTLTHVFEDVLQFSKLEYGYAQLNPRPFRLRTLLDEIVAVFAMSASKQRCPLSVAWPGELDDVFFGDPDKIRTVVSNFVGNAVKYAPGSPVEIRVMATEETGGHVDLYVDVTDQGPGIPPEEQGLIFKKFVRGSRAKEQEVPGTGLGLATCNVLARLMNGQVSVESTPGKGATFSLRLLLSRADAGWMGSDATGDEERDGDGKPRVLVVDDEPYNRTVLEGLALELGYLPDLTANAMEALVRLQTNRYRVVFLDWELPGLKGGEIARQIRAMPHGDRPIILATTAHDSDEMQQRCRQAGMDGFLLKPFNAPRVRQAIDAVRTWRATQQNPVPANGDGEPGFWSEKPVQDQAGLDFGAFDQYARARPHDPAGGRVHFLQTLESQTEALSVALAANNWPAVASIAHRLRALAGLVRARDLNEAAGKLEQAARWGAGEERTFHGQAVLSACRALRADVELAAK